MATILEDFEDATLNLTITGNWARASGSAAFGTWSLKSATIGSNGSTSAVVTVPAGATSLTFRYRVSSEQDFDLFRVLIDGAEVLLRSGEVPWTPATFDVTGKSQVIFRYTKDVSDNSGSDAAWVDHIEFTVPDTGTPKSSTDSGTLVEMANVAQVPEVSKASGDSGHLVETRWVNEPQSGTVPPTIRSTSPVAARTVTYTIDAPAGVAANDVLIAIQAADSGSTADMTVPTGGTTWQPLDSLDGIGELGVAQVIRVWWKRAGSSEPGLYTFQHGIGSDGVCLIVAVKDASLAAAPQIVRSTSGTGLNITTLGITPSSESDVELRLVAAYSLGTAMTFAAPAGLTPLNHIQSRIYTVAAAAARLLQSNEATAPANFVASVDEVEWRAGYTLAIAPAVTGPPEEIKAASDAATLVESATVIVVPDGVPTSGDDTGTLTETAAATADVATSDMAALVESPAIESGPGGVDQATLAEASMLQLGWRSADQATLAETAQVDAQAASADTGTLGELVDIAKTIGPVASDAATLAEADAVEAQAVAADSGTLTEAAVAAVVKEASDSGQLVETVSTGLDASDAAVLVEHAAVDAVIAASDSAPLIDRASLEIPKSAVDAAVLVEHAEVADIGRAIVGVGIVRRGWSAHSPRRRWAVGQPRRAWRADSPHT